MNLQLAASEDQPGSRRNSIDPRELITQNPAWHRISFQRCSSSTKWSLATAEPDPGMQRWVRVPTGDRGQESSGRCLGEVWVFKEWGHGRLCVVSCPIPSFRDKGHSQPSQGSGCFVRCFSQRASRKLTDAPGNPGRKKCYTCFFPNRWLANHISCRKQADALFCLSYYSAREEVTDHLHFPLVGVKLLPFF